MLIFVSPVFSQQQFGSSLLIHAALLQPSFGIAGFFPQNGLNMESAFWLSHWKKKDNPYLKLYFSTYLFSNQTKKNFGNFGVDFQEKKVGTKFLTGLSYKYLDFLIGFQKENRLSYSIASRLQLYKHKSVFLKYQENFDKRSKNYQINFLSGDTLKIGFELGKTFYAGSSELTGGFSISLDLDLWSVGGLVESSTNRTAIYFSGKTDEFYQDYLLEEANPTIFKPYKKKKIYQTKPIPEKPKRKYVIYPLGIDELLRENIPISLCIQIAKASKSKDLYWKLKATLPSKIVKKLNRLQYLKNRKKNESNH
ncbi:MAG: hypothetical protein H7A23_11235 [Leptospiraceae bacterium]|nr:hypothetical protein [Leptospiraceae bacterium]